MSLSLAVIGLLIGDPIHSALEGYAWSSEDFEISL
jgi:hypothetical protein